HPLCVAITLAELELDKETIVAGILHDVVEDTDFTMEDVAREFSEEIALLVDGVTKLTQLNYDADKIELQAENLRKMFLAMAKDIRVIMIKLADRLHNQRTMQFQTPEKQKEKSRETMDIYAPLAQRLGISKIKIELDDLSLKYLEPEIYKDLAEKIALRKSDREAFVSSIIDAVAEKISDYGIDAQIDGRIKHFFSIYKKMKNQNKTLDQIYDLFAVRVLVEDVKDCYAVLGILHEMYIPIPGRFKDYIAMPKPNMYQSLHTTLIGPNGTPFEIQIRTYEMHRTAEYGIAAHWKYKEAQNGVKSDANEEEKLAWLRQILEWQREMSDSKEFLSGLKNDLDLFSDSVYCFTPSGDVKNLPAGSTPVDFAYAIHSAVGNKMVGARVNGKLVTIDYVLQNGDRVEIITSQNSKGPSRDWLNVVKSTQAKNKINQWFKSELKEDSILHGKNLLTAYCKAKAIKQSDISKPEFLEVCMRKYGFRDWDSVLAAIGRGALKEGQIVNRLVEEYNKKQKKEMTDEKLMESLQEVHEKKLPISVKAKTGIMVQGIDDVAVHFSKCCSPVPGDEI
ncbi:MAG: bifunctional (p)ppGpp synthetase/guanosine-3',5'-bis(diphosphate) 3'-pyrophosphohydrolase, partial [Lachnospiraceae bacterium]|nr:bifunctional (p)ppGpp synthetase/guanosine-3',5'-bis(diphosphate) 3'-pyrophosphohydrolase [Lachnospiraceae bacterium]